jgi:hypothetical protein
MVLGRRPDAAMSEDVGMDIRLTIWGQLILVVGILIAALLNTALGVVVIVVGGVISTASYFKDR